MKKYSFDTEGDFIDFLYYITGYKYCFAVGCTNSSKKDKSPEYQLMPEDNDDDGFFDWYCLERTKFQFFDSMGMCMCYFLMYRSKWKEELNTE